MRAFSTTSECFPSEITLAVPHPVRVTDRSHRRVDDDAQAIIAGAIG
jgi:hypothetical protein